MPNDAFDSLSSTTRSSSVEGANFNRFKVLQLDMETANPENFFLSFSNLELFEKKKKDLFIDLFFYLFNNYIQ